MTSNHRIDLARIKNDFWTHFKWVAPLLIRNEANVFKSGRTVSLFSFEKNRTERIQKMRKEMQF